MDSSDLGPLLGYGGALLAVALAGAVVVLLLRRRLFQPPGKPSEFTMEGLSELRAGGRISDEEFKRLRRLVLGLDAGDKKKHNAPSPSNSPLSDGSENDDGKQGGAEEDSPRT
jgi:hypothetical protein